MRTGKRRRKLLLLAIASTLIPVAIAAVFVFFPVNILIEQTTPPIVFQPGGNAGADDLYGTINVDIGENQTSATVTLHPTYQTTYYRDVLKITNVGTKTMYIYIRVSTPVSIPAGGYAKLIINGTEVDLSTVADTFIGQLDPGEHFTVNAEFYLPEGNPLITTSASIQLVYSPSNESP